MPTKKAPKAAYAVCVGRNPGVYRSWSETEREVKGFSHAHYRGYTHEDGGMDRAERDFREFSNNSTLTFREDHTSEHARSSEGQVAKPASPEESVRVEVSSSMPPIPTSGHDLPQQLQTPPSTLNGVKKARSVSWDVEQDLRKKALCMDKDGTLGATRTVSEHDFNHTTYRTTPSAISSPSDGHHRKAKDGYVHGDANLNQECSGVNANATSSDCLSSSDKVSGSRSFDEHSHFFGDKKAECGGQVLVAADTEEDSGASVQVSNDHSESAGEDLSPNLSLRETFRSAELDRAASHDETISVNLLAGSLDPFSPALDYIPLSSSSDYGDFPEDVLDSDLITPTVPKHQPYLCHEQLVLVEKIMSGENVFYTGSAGCGKSTVLKHFVTLLRDKGRKVDIIAPTGRAALEVNGRTLYNYAGWVPGSLAQPLSNLERFARGKKVRKRLTATHVLVIDEISMVSNHVFERLNHIMKSARDNRKPFGGVQIVVSGDFCQLPPVNGFKFCLECGINLRLVSKNKKGKYECVKCLTEYKEVDKWAFCSAAWDECNFAHVNLKVIHRQKDVDFKRLLEKLRLGVPYTIDEELLILRHECETQHAVRLFPLRADAKEINDQEFAKLSGQHLTYLCVDHFFWNSEHDDLEKKGDRCPKPMNHALKALEEHALEAKLVLKEGMLVMLVVNWDLESSLANGSQGTIVGFEEHNPDLFPEVPRKWDYSGRKNGLVKVFINRTTIKKWPIVQFLNGNRRTIYPRCMINELGDDEPYSLLSRTQIPLIAAWAITVHKAQGMTLSRVIVDLKDSFEPGHDYVALSRAETLKGLKVLNLPEKGTSPDKQVIQFMEDKDLMPAIDSPKHRDTQSERVKEDG